jgi:nitrile hydratase subunit beta
VRPGDRVRVRVLNPPGHNRAPVYVRGRTGTVVRSVGDGRFPDEAASIGADARREEIWTVAFAATELWGADAGPHDHVHVDLFESYLERA